MIFMHGEALEKVVRKRDERVVDFIYTYFSDVSSKTRTVVHHHKFSTLNSTGSGQVRLLITMAWSSECSL